MSLNAILLALGITALAGLSTGVGGLINFFVKKPTPKFMGFTLGFSAGVMILISFVELLDESIEDLSEAYGEGLGFPLALLAFFGGMTGIFLLDILVPHDYIGDHDDHDTVGGREEDEGLLRVGILTAVGIAIHNFPEGLATFFATLHDVRLGVSIAVAIAIHNIPEGIAVAAPVYAATGSRVKGFLYSLYAGLAEPAGALIAAVILLPFLSEALLGWVLGAVGGFMVAISLDEIMPAAKTYGSKHTPIVGTIFGMIVMALSLVLLGT